MKTFIIAALSADGFIAKNKEESSTKWTSPEDTKHFIEKTKDAGVVVMGSTTFETFGSKPLSGRRNIIYTHSKQYENAETTNESPDKLLERLESEGIETVAIAGGSSIYTMFAKSGLVDKLILTIENTVFGQGMNLFTESLDLDLTLNSNTQIGPGTVVLEYEVNNK